MAAGFDPLGGYGQAIGLGLQGAGMLANYFTGQGAANKSKQLMGLQRGFARRQLGQYDMYQPQYNKAMEDYANQIGASNSEGLNGYVPQTGVSPHQAARLGIDPNTQFQNPGMGTENGYNLGPYGNQSYRLLRQGAEQDIQRQMQGQDQNLMFQLGQQGIATGSQAAALGREHSDMLRGYSDYLRNLAINAGDKQRQQQQQYIAMLQGAMAPGAEGAGILGQQGAMYGQQAQNAFGAMGGIAQNYVQNQAMQNAMQQMYGGGGGASPTTTSWNGAPMTIPGVGTTTPTGPPAPGMDPAYMEYLRSQYGYYAPEAMGFG